MSTITAFQTSAPPWIVFRPTVELLAATFIANESLKRDIYGDHPSYIKTYSDGEALIEFAGRQCYESFHNPKGRTNEEYVQNIINLKHFSVLEHANVTFLLEGVSRSFTHELVRHRHNSYSQLSQRYVDSRDSRYVCPPLVRTDPELYLSWLGHVNEARERLRAFQDLMERRFPATPRKKVREVVRSLALNSIETKIVVTGNLRAWREYLDKRWHEGADAEICEVSEEIAMQLKDHYPATFADIERNS